MTGFRDEVLRRYSRQILLREVGGRGQRAILSCAVDLRVFPGGAGIAAVAAQYLLRAGIRQVRWFADAQTETGPLEALHAIEPDNRPLDDGGPANRVPDDRTSDVSSCDSHPDPSQGAARLLRGLPADRPAGLDDPPPDALCLAIWIPCAGEPSRLWATVDGCTGGGSHAPIHAVDPPPTRHASIDADALVLGSALALGVLQAVLRIPPQVDPYFSLGQG